MLPVRRNSVRGDIGPEGWFPLRILVVDDDEMVRLVCTGMLNVMNHDVVAVESGADALRQIQLNEIPFDIILIDDAMPGMTGKEVIQTLFTGGYRIPVIICSGKNVALDEFFPSPDYGPLAILRKPFTLKQLQKVLAVAAGE